ncbi:MAG: GNAT family N-acetyltransferase [Nocardioidaceae bacterium]
MTEVEVAKNCTPELVEAFNRLLPQLSMSASSVDVEALQRVLSWNGNVVFVARCDGQIVGALTLVTFPIPSGPRSWIEDVVVDEAARGKGVGEALVERAIQSARASGVRSVDLTSRPTRAAANRLYQRLGFELRESVLYRRSNLAEHHSRFLSQPETSDKM